MFPFIFKEIFFGNICGSANWKEIRLQDFVIIFNFKTLKSIFKKLKQTFKNLDTDTQHRPNKQVEK